MKKKSATSSSMYSSYCSTLPHSLSKGPLILLKQPELPNFNTVLHHGLCADPGYNMIKL